MMELDIDQSHLPRVQEVCQSFAVLEDGALAHNLQEQEIEQYYNSNVQKNQLVQNDIRVAKRLQDEEEQRASQATRQLEERDSEYARMIQEEIRRCAEESRRREEEDEEIAKRLQEEEELDVRRLDSGCHRDSSDLLLREGAAPRRDGVSLELGELGQVLRDEELARMLQEEEEERPLRKSPTSPRDPQNSSLRGDFTVAQVAQDEEIARFMQRNERKAQRQSCDLEGQGSRREHRDPGNAQERRSTRERKVELPQGPRQRLDSEGLNSPSEDLSLECQPPSPNCAASQLQAVRNIAEELDPTFKAKRRDSNSTGQTSSGLSTSPSSPSGLHDYAQEPTFVPPTKRQSNKSARTKTKEKKESCKQQ